MGIMKKLATINVDTHDLAFVSGGLLFVVGLGILKLWLGIAVAGLLLMGASYLTANTESKDTKQQSKAA